DAGAHLVRDHDVQPPVTVELADGHVHRAGAGAEELRVGESSGAAVDQHVGGAVPTHHVVRAHQVESPHPVDVADRDGDRLGAREELRGGRKAAGAPVAQHHTVPAGVVDDGEIDAAVAVEVAGRDPGGELVRADRVSDSGVEGAVAAVPRGADFARLARYPPVSDREIGAPVAVQIGGDDRSRPFAHRVVDVRREIRLRADQDAHGPRAVRRRDVVPAVAVQIGDGHVIRVAIGAEVPGPGEPAPAVVAQQVDGAAVRVLNHQIRLAVAGDVAERDRLRHAEHGVVDGGGKAAVAQTPQHADRAGGRVVHAVARDGDVRPAVAVEIADRDGGRVEAGGIFDGGQEGRVAGA